MTRTGAAHPHQPFPQPAYLPTEYNWDSDALKGKADRRLEIMERVFWNNEWMRISALCCQYAREARKGANCPACSGHGYLAPDEPSSELHLIAHTQAEGKPIYLCECAHSLWPEEFLPRDMRRSVPVESWAIL